MKRTPLSATLCLFLAILLSWLCIHLDTTPVSPPSAPADNAFSQARAMTHLQTIAKIPHSTGTAANAAVRNYILTTCAALGLDTAVQHTTGESRQQSGIAAGNIYNVIARLKGSANSKTVLIAAHYDSQPNAGGAGDDGSGCVAMLETARALKAGMPLNNDVLFLFTDAEEDGLLGAEAFVKENPLLKEIGVMLNFDARGSSGPCLLSETNPGNGWVIDGYARSGAHRNASSLNYEVYKRLPNNTDYTPFKEKDIAGLNNAFIDGFVHYHSMTDIPANLNPGTLQEEGDNMLAEARYFGNADIRDTKAPDLTFFNLIGNWFIHYPASLNIVFLLLVNILLLVCLFSGFAAKNVRIPGLISGFLAFPLILIILYFLSDWTLAGIRSVEPLYEGYYSNTYSPVRYFLPLACLGIAVFTFAYRWLLERFSMPSIFAGTLIFLVILLDAVYALMPTAIYFLCFPLLILLAAGPFTFFRRASTSDHQPQAEYQPQSTRQSAPAHPSAAPYQSASGYQQTSARQSVPARHQSPSPLVTLILLIPAILLLAPIFAMFFVAFDLQSTSAAVPALTALLLGMSLPLLAPALRERRWLLPGGAFILFVVTLAIGFLRSSHSSEQPLKTNLQYIINADEGKARWVTIEAKPDHWNKQFFPNPKYLPTETIYPGGLYGLPTILTNEAPLEKIPAPILTVRQDTIINGRRLLALHYEAPGTNSARFTFGVDNPPTQISFKEPATPNPGNQKYYWLEYIGIPDAGMDFQVTLNPKTPVTIHALSRSIGLPQIQGFKGFPPDIIPGPGNYSNATIITKNFTF
jgi:hypothetical protein